MNINNLKDFLLFDGAFGTMLQKKGLVELGEMPPVLNITKPEEITEIFNEYVDAGSEVVTTNTFEANRLKLKDTGYSVEEIVKKAIENTKKSKAKYTALDIGPTGSLLKPMGTLSFDEAYDIFQEIIKAADDQTDLIILETFSDILELKAALLAAKENSNLPVICSMTFNEDGRTFTGTDPITAAITLEELGADVIGVNCSLGPDELYPVIETLVNTANIPIIVQANAGLPKIIEDQTVYDIAPKEYAKSVSKIADLGVSIIGGCCGTDPDYIAEVKKVLDNKTLKRPKNKVRRALTTNSNTTFIDDGIKVIGERINPTGRENLKEALRSNTVDPFISEAIAQQNEGADLIDINVGLPEIDETERLPKVVSEISGIVDIPIQVDSSNPKALENALRVFPGIAIVNSVNGANDSLEAVLPIVKKYGAYVIGLCLDENGIPKTVEGRLNIAKKIIDEAQKYGIPKKKIIIDALCLTASAQQEAVRITLDTIKELKKLGVLTTLGVSNVSFGLPEREMFNSIFLAAALEAGLDLPIINPGSEPISETVDVFRVINNEDRDSANYIKKYSNSNRKVVKDSNIDQKEEIVVEDLTSFIINGLKDKAVEATEELLKTETPEEIVNTYFVPALNIVGKSFEKGKIFLPQLMQSAAAVQGAFELIKRESDKKDAHNLNKGKILLATVKGDIHDIGKNIVKMMLENYGYQVFDLGNDVPSEKILEKLSVEEIPLVGLSALMTTTVESMREIIEDIKREFPKTRIMVGGAVLTEDYSNMINADYYAKDAQASVRIANKIFDKGIENE